MKQRTTFLLKSIDFIDTDNLVFSEDQVTVPGSVVKSRQDRLTVAFDELPKDLAALFSKIYMFRVQWSSKRSIPSVAFQNFGQIGFTVNLVPSNIDYETTFDKFGLFVHDSFNVAFNHTNMISTATSATYHTLIDVKSSSLQKFLNKITSDLDRISYVDHFDIIYSDGELKIQWITSPYDTTLHRSSTLRKEIALFEGKELQDDYELTGIRTVLSEEEYVPPTKTLLFVKPRHHLYNYTLEYDFLKPLGLHPTMKISNLENIPPPPASECELFIYSTVPQSLIFDKYQYNTKALSLLNSWGENDLEAPVWKVSKFGSNQLIRIIDTSKDIEIKYHSRYLKPSSANQFELLTPNVFYACDAQDFIEDHELIESNPFDSYSLGYESFFEPSTVFYHFQNNKPSLTYEIPTADASSSDLVQYITMISVCLGIAYLFKSLWTGYNVVNSSNKVDEKKEN